MRRRRRRIEHPYQLLLLLLRLLCPLLQLCPFTHEPLNFFLLLRDQVLGRAASVNLLVLATCERSPAPVQAGAGGIAFEGSILL